MDPADILIVVLMFVGATLPIGFGSAWYFTHRRARELEAQIRGGGLTAQDRLEALERHVAALTDQLDQLASGQEFLNRLLAKRAEQLPGAPPASVITPR